ncbi:hypothetical protein PG1C_03060 [Rugosibacter aromaticivorans]|uniref:KaiC-like domain-containing protein n=1 Tax=Rugosibacter aromaticivorans TaxID=1565605 RepID=A0A0C5J708_9PROT|nr:ATPase domain-containing protein [Rugosibacter aromaticivorans]AJP47715.1 hypothetical protein PG1C_03060 [Rugosibacter aromaticivorans]TBR12847.1 MAG: hypothetical protein EPO43_12785 [Rugosibacter sp.]
MTTHPAKAKRISTGITGCDDIQCGVLISGRSYLLRDPADSGKTAFSLQWLRDGVARGEKCMYITLAEPGAKIRRNVAGFGWALDGIGIMDIALSMEGREDESVEYRVPSPARLSKRRPGMLFTRPSKPSDRTIR